MTSRACQFKIAPLQATVLVDEGEVQETERHKAVARQQSCHQVTALMEDNVKDEGYQDSNEHPEDLSHGLQRELVSDAAVHCRDGLTLDQGDEGTDNNDADACSNEHINEEFQYGFHYPNSDYVIPAANIISFLVSAPLVVAHH